MSSSGPPVPTGIFRLVHLGNLPVLLRRRGLHAPDHCPEDGEQYRTIHDEDVQRKRAAYRITCGPRGSIHDYVPFYFGYRSPMLLRLKSGRVTGYSEGQEPLLYLVTTAQDVLAAGLPFVFSDGHGIARFTAWSDDLGELGRVDWGMVYQQYWSNTGDDNDRQRRKQAEFLIHRLCPWRVIRGIGVVNEAAKRRVEEVLRQFPAEVRKPVSVRPGWYYP